MDIRLIFRNQKYFVQHELVGGGTEFGSFGILSRQSAQQGSEPRKDAVRQLKPVNEFGYKRVGVDDRR